MAVSLCLFIRSRISKEKMTIILIQLLFPFLKMFSILVLREGKLRLFKVSDAKTICVLSLLDECVLKLRILVAGKKWYIAESRMPGPGWGGGGRERRWGLSRALRFHFSSLLGKCCPPLRPSLWVLNSLAQPHSKPCNLNF